MKKIICISGVIILTVAIFTACKSKGGHRGGIHPAFCLTGETKIAIDNGKFKEIKNLKNGDVILSYNESENKVENAVVDGMKKVMHDNVYNLHFTNSDIKMTNDHPVWTKGKGWSSLDPKSSMEYMNLGKISQLEPGDICFVMNAEGKVVESEFRSLEKLQGAFETFTITRLSKNNRFFANGIVVAVEELKELQ